LLNWPALLLRLAAPSFIAQALFFGVDGGIGALFVFDPLFDGLPQPLDKSSRHGDDDDGHLNGIELG
jgi:hypothetical protein